MVLLRLPSVGRSLSRSVLTCSASNTDLAPPRQASLQLDIPDYETDEICRDRLATAAELCGNIDTDMTHVADESD